MVPPSVATVNRESRPEIARQTIWRSRSRPRRARRARNSSAVARASNRAWCSSCSGRSKAPRAPPSWVGVGLGAGSMKRRRRSSRAMSAVVSTTFGRGQRRPAARKARREHRQVEPGPVQHEDGARQPLGDRRQQLGQRRRLAQLVGQQLVDRHRAVVAAGGGGGPHQAVPALTPADHPAADGDHADRQHLGPARVEARGLQVQRPVVALGPGRRAEAESDHPRPPPSPSTSRR